jgi:hypothetical protein
MNKLGIYNILPLWYNLNQATQRLEMKDKSKRSMAFSLNNIKNQVTFLFLWKYN